MSKLFIPEGYKPSLDLYRTQRAISFIKQSFQESLSKALNLKRVSAPLFVTEASGLNDNLNGTERPVSFDIPDAGEVGQVVHSLAKWKRLALKEYGFYVGYGLYTDMNAIRRDEELDNIHSIYVDQWDWEKVITKNERTLAYLCEVASTIVGCICDVCDRLREEFPELSVHLKREMTAITTQELEDMYPDLTPKEREKEIAKKHGAVFIMQIGGKLKSGKIHDGRAPDYDDWELNGDIVVYYPVLDIPFELSSMGIRVDKEALERQLKERGCEERRELAYHKALLNGDLPYTIGGGIGQSRMCMYFLRKAHIGEVHSSFWDAKTTEECLKKGVKLL